MVQHPSFTCYGILPLADGQETMWKEARCILGYNHSEKIQNGLRKKQADFATRFFKVIILQKLNILAFLVLELGYCIAGNSFPVFFSQIVESCIVNYSNP